MTMMKMNHSEAPVFPSPRLQWLRRLVGSGENEAVEFKRKAAFPVKIVREMVAFANSNGGKLLIGVDDDGKLPGLKYPEEETFVVRKALRKYCRPWLKFHLDVIAVSPNRYVLMYEIPPSKRKPHFLIQGGRRESYVRVADKCIKASREVLEIARHASRSVNFGFTYGEPERTLLNYLDQNETITLAKFAEISGLQHLNASEKLVLLVLTDILKITPHERGDLYSLSMVAQKF
jgi:predicted HTH transcriptional regulator